MNKVAEFSRAPNENLIDFGVLYMRTTHRLDTLGVKMSE